MAQGEAITVSSLHIYPVKSCAGVQLQQAQVTPTGFLFDRQWMVVREDNGKFVSQRKEPRLALVQPQLPATALQADPDAPLPPGLTMTLTAPGKQPLEVPLDVPESAACRQCTVWEWTGPAADTGDGAAAWLSDYLGKPLRLVRYAGRPGGGGAASDIRRRATDSLWAPANETAFADGFPYLLIGEGSLAELNSGMAEALPMNRFRPNIVVTGAPGWTEDAWRRFRIGAIDFEAVKPCSRCKETTVDQKTAAVGAEPLEMLRATRSGTKLGWAEAARLRSWKHAVFFGQNLVALQPRGIIKVGQAVEVASKRNTTSTTSAGATLVWKELTVPPPPGLGVALLGGRGWVVVALLAALLALVLRRALG